MIFATIVYYAFSASAFLLYGIGLHNLISAGSGGYGNLVLTGTKSLITVATTTTVSYLIVNALFVPVRLAELYPLVAVIVFVLFSAVIEVFVTIGLQNSATEFGVPLLCVLLALNEASSVGVAVIIAVSCVAAFYLLCGIVFALRNRFSLFAPVQGLRVYCLLLVSLAVILIALGAFNVSWLMQLEVGR